MAAIGMAVAGCPRTGWRGLRRRPQRRTAREGAPFPPQPRLGRTRQRHDPAEAVGAGASVGQARAAAVGECTFAEEALTYTAGAAVSTCTPAAAAAPVHSPAVARLLEVAPLLGVESMAAASQFCKVSTRK